MPPSIDYIRLLSSGSLSLLKEERVGCELLLGNREWKNESGETLLSYGHRNHRFSWSVDVGKVAEMLNAYGVASDRLDILVNSGGKNYLFRGIELLDFTTNYHQEQPVEGLLHTKLILSYLPGKHLEEEI